MERHVIVLQIVIMLGRLIFNCGEQGHISNNYYKPNKVQSRGKVFALTGPEATS